MKSMLYRISVLVLGGIVLLAQTDLLAARGGRGGHPDPLRPAGAVASGSAQVADISIGRHLAETVCSACHQISTNAHGPGPNPDAPNFVDISRMSMSKLDIKVFLRSSHPSLPTVILSSAEIDSIAAYIERLNKE